MLRSLALLLVLAAPDPGRSTPGEEPPPGADATIPIPPPPPPPDAPPDGDAEPRPTAEPPPLPIPPPPPPPDAPPGHAAPPPAAPEPPPLPPPPPSASAARPEAEKDGWIDASHAFIEQRIFAPVLRVDRFFSDERDLEAERARSFLRWRNELRFPEGADTPGYTTSLTANLRLPGLNKQLRRLRIEIAGQTRDAFSTLLPEDGAAPADVVPSEQTLGTADAGLRFRLWQTLRTHGDLGGGVMLQLPPGAYGRIRFRFVEPLGRRLLARQALTMFWRTDDTGFGSTGSADLERPIAREVLARLAASTTITEDSRQFDWIGDLSLLATFRGRLGVQVGGAMTGATREPVVVERYRVYTRLRRDFYRRWIFLELEPEYAWPWTVELGRHRRWAVALRLEVQFQGNEAPAPRPPPAPDPEPADPPTGALPFGTGPG